MALRCVESVGVRSPPVPPAGGPGRGGARLRCWCGHGAAAAAGPEGLGARVDVQPQIPALPLSSGRRPHPPAGCGSAAAAAASPSPLPHEQPGNAPRSLQAGRPVSVGLYSLFTQTSLVDFLLGVLSFFRTGTFPHQTPDGLRMRGACWVHQVDSRPVNMYECLLGKRPPTLVHLLRSQPTGL